MKKLWNQGLALLLALLLLGAFGALAEGLDAELGYEPEALPEDGLSVELEEFELGGDELAVEAPAEYADFVWEGEPQVMAGEEAPAEFVVDENGVLTAYNGNGGDVRIPETVKRIPGGVFSRYIEEKYDKDLDEYIDIYEGNATITSLYVPKTIQSIENSAFRNCGALTSVTLEGYTVPTDWKPSYESEDYDPFGSEIFADCPNLTAVTVSTGKVGYRMFRNCPRLSSVTLGEGVTSIESRAFRNCAALASIAIPGSVTYIGGYAFENCAALTAIVLPDSVTSVGDGIFEGCKALATVTLSKNLNRVSEEMFWGCEALTAIEIPAGVQSIEWAAFNGCKALATVTLNDGLDEIYSKAFSGCAALTAITIPETVSSISENAFKDCAALTSIAILSRDAQIDTDAFKGVAADAKYSACCSGRVANWLKARGIEPAEKFHHTISRPAVAATCVAPGLTEGKVCIFCAEEVVKQEIVPRTAHTPVEIPAVAATYTATGLTAGKYCAVCDAELEEQQTVKKLVPSKVKLNKKKATVKVGKTLKLKATLTPNDATASSVKLTWKSSNTKVATVTAKGKVKGIKAGTATITVTTPNGKKATCKITVKK